MNGYFRGFWYAQVIESTRGRGRVALTVHAFHTQKEMDDFINNYNQVLLEHDGVPDVYRMAEYCTEWDVWEHVRKNANRWR